MVWMARHNGGAGHCLGTSEDIVALSLLSAEPLSQWFTLLCSFIPVVPAAPSSLLPE